LMGLVWARIDISGQHPREDMMRVFFRPTFGALRCREGQGRLAERGQR